MTDPAAPVPIRTEGLTKHYRGVHAIEDLDLEVQHGEVFGFLGPNGAGKTTTIRALLHFIFPTRGRASILGRDAVRDSVEIRRHVGYMPADYALYPNLTGAETLGYYANLRGGVDERVVASLAERLAADLSRKNADLSSGNRQKVALIAAFMSEPELLILDEPTSGLDPQGMKDVRELIRELGAAGTTVFLSSHLLHEVEQVCTRAVIIDHGRVVVQGPVADLRPRNDAVKVLTGDQRRAAETLRTQFGPGAVIEDDGFLVVKAGDDAVGEMVRRLVGDGLDVHAVVPAPEQGLEDFFLELTGDEA
ncbi:ABC transporter ATP-binding protein, partial [bacterium]|nr:ABC transporter ATP-binding protein [bacterium]